MWRPTKIACFTPWAAQWSNTARVPPRLMRLRSSSPAVSAETVANLYKLGRLFGVPYIPVTPYLVAIPKPVNMYLEYGEPMRFEGTGREDDDTIAEMVEQVVDRISVLIANGVERQGGRRP